ncbi:hypothetical protein [Agarivorans sp. Toyoura001]|uniref:hypothetical protein n=1 Tax=unclassified Agarivorans TaxID=2636026 RepID=UPI0010CF14A4|nr:hypothetical protein [Agarivorans sp. Toyoura001]GDY27123.1 hypothetical protein AHAT_30130 [Agarivorans sp. Toyoura001]
MVRILERSGKQRECPNCSFSLKYSWLSRLNRDLVSLYSLAGDAILVSESLRGLSDCCESPELTLGSAVLSYLESRDLEVSYQFALRNELKCPKCNIALTSRSDDSYESILNSRPVFLNGMTFINDSGIYEVKVIVQESELGIEST